MGKSKGHKTSKPPKDLSKPAAKMSKGTNEEVYNAFMKALSRKKI